MQIQVSYDEMKKGYPVITVYGLTGQTEIRNICWNCENYFDTVRSDMFEAIEKGQKVYLKCNHCKKINHL